jgi:hypothetical protein
MSGDETISKRPTPKRPATGLLAWQATTGYIQQEYDTDAIFSIFAYPLDDGSIRWAATLAWSGFSQEVEKMPELADALKALWVEVESRHRIFKSMEAMSKSPANYADSDWVDEATATTLDRLIQVTSRAFQTDWLISIMYRPLASPNERVQTSLSAQSNQVQVIGYGPAIREACQTLYRNAATYFASRSE